MDTIQIRTLEGPNVWSRRRVLEAELIPAATATDELNSAIERLDHWFAAADRHRQAQEYPSLPFASEHIDDLTVLLTLVLNLERRVGLPVEEGFVVRGKQAARSSRIIVEIVEENVGRHALALACQIWTSALRNTPFDLGEALEEFSNLAFESCLGQTTGAIVAAARTQGIPVIRLDDVSLVQLGHGAHQRRIQTAVSDQSGFIAEAVSRDKALTKSLLRRVGLPVPNGRVVSEADDAWAAAKEFQSPVVVKPRDADYGQGVSLRLTKRDEIVTAFHAARAYSEQVIVEQYLEGDHHRLLVIGGKVVAAVRFGRVAVIGDGQRSIHDLIAEMNRDPRRGARDDSTRPWFLMEVDDETRRVLHSQGSSLDHVPDLGQRIILRFEPRIGWGGGVFDITDQIHADVSATVIDAVAMVGLDIAGVDLITSDITRPLEEVNGGILEVNAGPAILMHLRPFSDPPRPVPEAIVSLLFPRSEQSRIPIVAICGDDQRNSSATGIAEVLRTIHSSVGLAGRTGVFVNQRLISRKSGDDLQAHRMLLLHPRVEAAALSVSLDRIRVQGLAFDQCEIAVVMGLDSGRPDPSSTRDDQLASLQVLLSAAQNGGDVIVNLDDPHVAEIAFRPELSVIAISSDERNPLRGGIRSKAVRRVFLQDGMVMIGQGANESRLLTASPGLCHLQDDPATTASMLAAVAAGWALGKSLEILASEFACPTNEASAEPRHDFAGSFISREMSPFEIGIS